MVPVAPVIAGIIFAVTFHICWISVMKSLYFTILSASFLVTFLSPAIIIIIIISSSSSSNSGGGGGGGGGDGGT